MVYVAASLMSFSQCVQLTIVVHAVCIAYPVKASHLRSRINGVVNK